ncbi:MAG TPA: hypothetical protein VMA09_09695 [Candidatus Binataceae bacterium]|nr:hypothetical protein [Candidatus Binataceae bacterium]
MKKNLKLALGMLAFGTIALATMPTGRAFAQTADLKEACTNKLKAECIDEVGQDTKCCLDPSAEGCRVKIDADAERAAAPESPEACILAGLRDLADCAKCEFPDGNADQ